MTTRYTVRTNRGATFDITTDDISAVLAQLNDQQKIAIAFGSIGMSKRNITSVAPTDAPEDASHTLYTADGGQYAVTLAGTVNDAVAKVNERPTAFIEIGGVLIQPNHFDMIVENSATQAQ